MMNKCMMNTCMMSTCMMSTYTEGISSPELLQGSVWVGSHAVQLVDEGEEGHVIALHLPVDCHALTLHPSHRTQNQDRSVQHPQGALNLNGEVNVTYTGGIHVEGTLQYEMKV